VQRNSGGDFAVIVCLTQGTSQNLLLRSRLDGGSITSVSNEEGWSLIAVKCPSDGTLHYADDTLAGRTIRCRTCGATLTIGSPDQPPIVEVKPEPLEPEAGTIVTAESPLERKTNDTAGRVPPWIYILGGAGFGAIVVILLFAFWSGRLSPVSRQMQSQGNHPSVSETSPEASPGGSAPTAARHAPDGQPAHTKPVAETNPNGPLPACAQGRAPSRLGTGQRIEPDSEMSGQSDIRVTNASDLDVAVRLADSVTGKTARFVYIQAGYTFAFESVAPGAYVLRFQFGKDWVADCRGFVRDSLYGEFSDPFVFYDDRIRFYTVTLSPSLGGGTRTRRIDRRRFLEGDQGAKDSP
jgi:hypothetical protein